MPLAPRRNLPRLAAAHCQGLAAVHWTFSLQDRAIGWLSDTFHAAWRELLLHATVRHGVICPGYCLMPDHQHLLLLGVSPSADQRSAVRFIRRHAARALPNGTAYQKQAHDHVLREAEREQGAFAALAYYITENPVRAGLCAQAGDWPWSGCIVPGYPDLTLHDEEYWPRFWRIHASLAERPLV